MIKVNGRMMDWHKDMYVTDVLKVCGYTYPDLIISLNGKHISKDFLSSTTISDGDRISIIHPIVGG